VLGHKYPIVSGVPVFLLAEKQQTIGIASASLEAAERGLGAPLYIDTLGISEQEKRGIENKLCEANEVDPVISYLIGATSGWSYATLIGKMFRYPIPNIPLDHGTGEFLLDVGSNWGRWSVSAARKGWRVIGIDPSLGAIMAARRAFHDMELDISFVCGDARYLPFKGDVFRRAFSYSVIQHFSEIDAELAIAEIGRVLCQDGCCKIQMAHRGGIRSSYNRTRKNYTNAGIFRVRYWSLAAMRRLFERNIGPCNLVAEAFGGLGLLAEDRMCVSAKARILIVVSEFFKKLCNLITPLILLADSVYVVSVKRGSNYPA
jgi:SAM-dependent methyltransferase